MKVIVNRRQYNKVINETRGYSKNVEEWADYVADELLPLIIKSLFPSKCNNKLQLL